MPFSLGRFLQDIGMVEYLLILMRFLVTPCQAFYRLVLGAALRINNTLIIAYSKRKSTASGRLTFGEDDNSI